MCIGKKSPSFSIGALDIEQEVFREEVKLKSPHHFKDFAGTEELHQIRSKCGKKRNAKCAYGAHCSFTFFSLIVSLVFFFPFCILCFLVFVFVAVSNFLSSTLQCRCVRVPEKRQKQMTREMFVCSNFQIVTFDYGMRDRNPIDELRFYAKNAPDVPMIKRKDEASND